MMRIIVIFSLAFSLAPRAHAFEDACEITENHEQPRLFDNHLSPFWGYEFSGVDLANDFLNDYRGELSTISYGTWEYVNLSDLPQNKISKELNARRGLQQFTYPDQASHGTQVNVIANGQYPFGVASRAQLAICAENLTNGADGANPDQFLESALSKGVRVFAVSTTASNGDFFNKLQSNNILSIRSAGNYYPSAKSYQENPGASIIVGQTSPLGLMSGDSSAYPEVTISAPGMNLSIFKKKIALFSGTSGAQPVVSGCVMNLLSVLPNLSQEQVKKIIVSTSLHTVNYEESPQLNGAGTINCYKMIKVAERLSKVPSSDLIKKIDQSETYVFTDESKDLYSQALRMRVDGCEQKKLRFKLFRASFLLDQQNISARDRVLQDYLESGLDINAFAIMSLTGDLNQPTIEKIYKIIKSTDLEADLIRYLATKPSMSAMIQQTLQSSSNADAVILAAHAHLGGVDLEITKQALIRLLVRDQLNGFNYYTFEKLFHREYDFPIDILKNICLSKLSPTRNTQTVCDLIKGWQN